MTPHSGPRITKGSLLVYRVFEVAEEINLGRAEQLVRQETQQGRLRIGLRGARNPRSAIIMRNPPLVLKLPETQLSLGGDLHRCEVQAKIWDYGVLSFTYTLQLPSNLSWMKLVELAKALETSSDIDTDARKRSQELATLLKAALQDPHEWADFEDYAIYFLEDVEGVKKSSELLERADVGALIQAEPTETLSERNREGVREYTFQYSENDLAVVDWNSALVLEPSGSRDLPDILEFALTHQMELRYYDELLDQQLDNLYTALERRRQSLWKSDYSRLSREAFTIYIELSEFLERVENSLKVVGDFYHASVLRAALRRFRIPDWQQSISRKMNLLAQTSQLLQGEVNVQRSHMLELIIILLIAMEMASAFLKL